MAESFPVKEVVNMRRWISFMPNSHGRPEYRFNDILVSTPPRHFSRVPSHPDSYYTVRGVDTSNVELIRSIYYKKIGELGTHWSWDMPIEFKYAKIKMGDVIDYYTTSDGVLQIPTWTSFKFAVDEYLEEAPHVKFHPSRVQDFIEQNGIDKLEDMELTSIDNQMDHMKITRKTP